MRTVGFVKALSLDTIACGNVTQLHIEEAIHHFCAATPTISPGWSVKTCNTALNTQEPQYLFVLALMDIRGGQMRGSTCSPVHRINAVM